MLKIFISYRREDSAGYAGRLQDRVIARFGAENVFMDVDSIQPGDDYFEAIRDQVGSCDVLLAVIGPRWARATDGPGKRRIDNPVDLVRIEVEAALERKIPVIPVLVGGAAPVTANELPDVLQPLARRQVLEISDTRFRPDVDRLIQALDRLADRLAKVKSHPTEIKTTETGGSESVTTTPSSSPPQTDEPPGPLPTDGPAYTGSDSGMALDAPSIRRATVMAPRLSKRWLSALSIVALVSAVGATTYTLSRPSRPAPEPIPPPRSEAPMAPPSAAPAPQPSLSAPPTPRVRSELAGFRIRVRSKTHDISMRRYCDLLEDAGLKVRCEVTNRALSIGVMDNKIFLNCARLPDNTPEIVSRIIGRELTRVVDWRRDEEVGASQKKDFCTAGYVAIELYLL